MFNPNSTSRNKKTKSLRNTFLVSAFTCLSIFSAPAHATHCIQHYNGEYQQMKWYEVSEPFWLGVYKAEGRKLMSYETAKLKSKHLIPDYLRSARSLTYSFRTAFRKYRYFSTMTSQLDLALMAYSSVKLAKSENLAANFDYYGEIKNLLNEVVLPLLSGKDGKIDSQTLVHLRGVLQSSELNEPKQRSEVDKIIGAYQARIENHIDFQQRRNNLVLGWLADFMGVKRPVGPRSEVTFSNNLEGVLSALLVTGVQPKEVKKLKNGNQLTLVLESSEPTFSENDTFNPKIIVKVSGSVAVILEQDYNGWNYRVVEKSEFYGFKNPNVKFRKMFQLSL